MHIDFVMCNKRSLESQGNKSLILHMNIRSLPNHFDEFLCLIQEFSTTPIAICLLDSWIKPINETCLFGIPGYHEPSNVAKTNKSSGVIIYIDERFFYNPINIQTSLENITVQMTSKHMSKLILSCVYNSPSLSKMNSLADIDNLLTHLNEHCDEAIVVGDMNFDLLKNSTSENKYRETVQ